MSAKGLLALCCCFVTSLVGCGGHGGSGDMAVPDLAVPDLTMPDLAVPDLTMPDLAVPDLTMPDLAMADLAMPDLTMPDLAMPDLAPGAPDMDPAPRTVVSLEFDDGWADQGDALALLAAHGFHATYYIISGKVGASGYFTLAQIAALAAAGHEIGGHTVTHPDLTSLTTDEARSEICDGRAALQSWGYSPISFAYPFGAANAGVEQLVAECGYDNARGVGGIVQEQNCPDCPTAESLPPLDPYYLRTPGSVRVDNTLGDLEVRVTQAEAGGGWVHIVMHHVCDGCDTYSVSKDTLGAFLDWLAPRRAQGTVVLPVAAAMKLHL